MRYFVIADNGQRYGPADIATLNQWVAEGRLLPHHLLEQEGTGSRMAAQLIPGIQFQAPQVPPSAAGRYGAPPGPGYSTGPQQPGAYYRPGQQGYGYPGEQSIKTAWILGGVSIAGAMCCAFIGLACGIVGLVMANRAKQEGNPNYSGPMILCALGTGLSALSSLYGMMIGLSMGRMF